MGRSPPRSLGPWLPQFRGDGIMDLGEKISPPRRSATAGTSLDLLETLKLALWFLGPFKRLSVDEICHDVITEIRTTWLWKQGTRYAKWMRRIFQRQTVKEVSFSSTMHALVFAGSLEFVHLQNSNENIGFSKPLLE